MDIASEDDLGAAFKGQGPQTPRKQVSLERLMAAKNTQHEAALANAQQTLAKSKNVNMRRLEEQVSHIRYDYKMLQIEQKKRDLEEVLKKDVAADVAYEELALLHSANYLKYDPSEAFYLDKSQKIPLRNNKNSSRLTINVSQARKALQDRSIMKQIDAVRSKTSRSTRGSGSEESQNGSPNRDKTSEGETQGNTCIHGDNLPLGFDAPAMNQQKSMAKDTKALHVCTCDTPVNQNWRSLPGFDAAQDEPKQTKLPSLAGKSLPDSTMQHLRKSKRELAIALPIVPEPNRVPKDKKLVPKKLAPLDISDTESCDVRPNMDKIKKLMASWSTENMAVKDKRPVFSRSKSLAQFPVGVSNKPSMTAETLQERQQQFEQNLNQFLGYSRTKTTLSESVDAADLNNVPPAQKLGVDSPQDKVVTAPRISRSITIANIMPNKLEDEHQKTEESGLESKAEDDGIIKGSSLEKWHRATSLITGTKYPKRGIPSNAADRSKRRTATYKLRKLVEEMIKGKNKFELIEYENEKARQNTENVEEKTEHQNDASLNNKDAVLTEENQC